MDAISQAIGAINRLEGPCSPRFPQNPGECRPAPCSRLPGVAIRATLLTEIQAHLGNFGILIPVG